MGWQDGSLVPHSGPLGGVTSAAHPRIHPQHPVLNQSAKQIHVTGSIPGSIRGWIRRSIPDGPHARR